MRKVQGSKVAVVGGAGFLGSHLVDWLIGTYECEVLVVDNLITGRREFINKLAKFEYADITKSESYLRRLFQKYEIEYVFNYAAEPYIPVSFERPQHVWSVNATGAFMVINAAVDAGVKAILQISSAEIYGEGRRQDDEFKTTGTLDENDPVVPHSTYGASKAAIDALIQVRWREARTPCIALRQFNCVGERETHPYVIPEIISQLSRGPTVRLGNNSSRDFLYAGDQACMAIELMEAGSFGEVYNLGSEKAIKIYELAELIGELMLHRKIEIQVDEKRKRPWEIWHLQSDNTKIYKTIFSKPRVSLEDALRRTIIDYHSNGGRWCWE